MLYIWIIVGALLTLNVALVVYFFNKFEKMFIIMKAGSLKDLSTYFKDIKRIEQNTEDDDDDMMP